MPEETNYSSLYVFGLIHFVPLPFAIFHSILPELGIFLGDEPKSLWQVSREFIGIEISGNPKLQDQVSTTRVLGKWAKLTNFFLMEVDTFLINKFHTFLSIAAFNQFN